MLMGLLAAACAPDREEENPLPVREDVYVQVMADLMLLDASPPEGETAVEREARADSIRAEILAAEGVTAEEILEFARALGAEADRMEVLWQRITQKYDSARVANLAAETEARSEPEGKLGDEAREAEADRRAPVTAGTRDSAGARKAMPRSRKLLDRRLPQTRPAAGDTAVLPG